MLVVADSSPLIVLINIGYVRVLPTLFGQVVVPSVVLSELRHSRRTQAVRDFIGASPVWLLERIPTLIEQIPSLHPGELAAITLAQELHADLLLIDENRGRKAAADRRIPITGTIGILELAAERGLIELQQAFSAVKATDFWISHALLDKRLRLFQDAKERTPPQP